ncbi:MAG: DUF4390 domain-containing protein [Gallionella sp.]|nr:MAG: DUF4390 domain-containing protein [Gallionella sp.]
MTEDSKTPAVPPRPDSIGRLGIGLYKYVILAALCLLSSVFCPLAAAAEGISINKAEVRLGEDGYHLFAGYDINLTFVAQQALSRGIPLYFVSEFSLTRSRWYWLDEEIFRGEQAVKLSYNVLTRQYRISRGALYQNFASIEEALKILARQSSAAIPAELIKKDGSYIAALVKKDGDYIAAARLRLDTTQLPKLLQVNALTGNDWTLNSDWHRWIIHPAGIAAGGGKAE